MKRGEFTVSGIVGLLITIVILVAVAIPVTISVMAGVTNPTYVNQTLAVTNNTYVTLPYYPIDISSGESPYVNITNGTNVGLTSGVNYTLQGLIAGSSYNGTIYFNQINPNWNTTTSAYNARVQYFYQQSGFDSSSTDRTILSILPLALAVILLVTVFTVISSGGNFA